MMKIMCAFLIFVVLCMTESTAKTAITPTTAKNYSARYEEHANNLLNEAATRMQTIWKRRRDVFIRITKKHSSNGYNYVAAREEIENDYQHLVYNLAANLSTIPIVELKNQTLRRQVQRLSKLQLRGLSKTEFESVKQKLHTKLEKFESNPLVCPFNHQNNCGRKMKMVPGILKEIITTKDLSEINYYWKKWRETINDRNTATNAFNDYIQMLRRAAAYNGHVTPSRTWYLYYETENFQRELEDVIWEIMPLYKELHAYLRHNAISQYGTRLTDSDGAIPAPVLEQMIHEAWLAPTILKTPYPGYKLPTVQPRLEEIIVQADKIHKKAVEFFDSLGLNPMTSVFYANFSRRMNTENSGPDCKSEIYYFPPEVAIRYCTEVDYKKLMQMHGKMAELQYNLYKKDLPFGLDREPCPGFSSALGETAVIASGTPRHLGTLRILSNGNLSPEQAMNRLFRMAVHTILAIPQYFINDRFLVDVLDGRIQSNEMNCGYWKLQYKFAGVVPPQTRGTGDFDPDYKFYRGLDPEKSNIIKFMSEVLGLSLYRAFCLASNSYRPGNPDYPLNNCDFFNSTKAGDLMKDIMQRGAKHHWRDTMALATGERKLSGKGIMEYFAPLYTWLINYNEENGLHVGWSDDIKCVKD